MNDVCHSTSRPLLKCHFGKFLPVRLYRRKSLIVRASDRESPIACFRERKVTIMAERGTSARRAIGFAGTMMSIKGDAFRY
jgi:hypothetical protein